MNELPQRKRTRLRGYDYSSPGAYFVTVCSHNRKCIFSSIVGSIHESTENKLTHAGEFVREIIENVPERYHITIDKYVIMPNHIHFIANIRDCGQIRSIRESTVQMKRSLIEKFVGYLKMNVSKKFHVEYPGVKMWQRSYHDHIIRDKKDYENIWHYIDTNVIRWESDCFYEKDEAGKFGLEI